MRYPYLDPALVQELLWLVPTPVASSAGAGTFTTLAATSLSLGGTAVTSTAAELNILDGVTSTTAELNIVHILHRMRIIHTHISKLRGYTSTWPVLQM